MLTEKNKLKKTNKHDFVLIKEQNIYNEEKTKYI